MKSCPLLAGITLVIACDSGPKTAAAPAIELRDGTAPEQAPAPECEPALPMLDPVGELTVSLLDPDPPWIRRVDVVVPLSADRGAVLCETGDFYTDGLLLVAFEEDGTTAWEARLPANDEFFEALVEPVTGGAWIAGREFFSSEVWRFADDGTELVATTVPNVSVSATLPTPGGGLWLAGFDPAQQPSFAELSATGELLWQGSNDLLQMDRVLVSDGTVQRLDPIGTVAWEHDPRPEPFDGFPLDVGATWARLLPSGAAVARGIEVAEGGDAAVLLRLDDSGDPTWRHVMPYVSLDRAWALPSERVLVTGTARACERTSYAGAFDDAGDAVVEGRSERRVLGIDGRGRIMSLIDLEPDALTLAWIGEVPS